MQEEKQLKFEYFDSASTVVDAFSAARICELQKKALDDAAKILTDAGIEFAPLKGAVMRQYYKEPWMRLSSDVDIYVKPENIKLASDKLVLAGFEKRYACGHDIVMTAPNGVTVELHFAFIDGDKLKEAGAILDNEIDMSSFVPGNEYYYLYHVSHMAMHFLEGGCGKKFFADLWILNNICGCDRNKINPLLEKSGLVKFDSECVELSNAWFTKDWPRKPDEELSDFVLSGGDYGSLERKVAANIARNGNGNKYILKRMFPPLDAMKKTYPVLDIHPYLLPIMWGKRGVSMLHEGKLAVLKAEKNSANKISQEEIDRMKKLFKRVGFDI